MDSDGKIRRFLPELGGMLQDGLVTLEAVEVIRYQADSGKGKEDREA